MHDLTSVLQYLGKVHQLDPCKVRILQQRGVIQQTLEDYKGAMEDLVKAFQLDPFDVYTLQHRTILVKQSLENHQGVIVDLFNAHLLDPCNFHAFRQEAKMKFFALEMFQCDLGGDDSTYLDEKLLDEQKLEDH